MSINAHLKLYLGLGWKVLINSDEFIVILFISSISCRKFYKYKYNNLYSVSQLFLCFFCLRNERVFLMTCVGYIKIICSRIAINLQTFDECVEKRQPDCNPDNMWLQIPFLCGHVAACWYVYTIEMLHLILRKTYHIFYVNHYKHTFIVSFIFNFIFSKIFLKMQFNGIGLFLGFASFQQEIKKQHNSSNLCLKTSLKLYVLFEMKVANDGMQSLL